MTSIPRPHGIRLELPDGLSLDETLAAARTRGLSGRAFGAVPMPSAQGAVGPLEGALMEVLGGQGFELLDQLDLRATGSGTTRGSPAGGPAQVGIDVPLGPEENAAVLVEQDGLLAWHFAGNEDNRSSAPVLRRGPVGSDRSARFTITLGASRPPAAAVRRGFIGDLVLAGARAYVLKFAARLAAGQLMAHLERKVERGWVLLDGNDALAWRRAAQLSELVPPGGTALHLLLFVHGTFSSTVGSFGGLAATPWGGEFLSAAQRHYDAVLGFDHVTLSEDPLANARELLRGLEAGAAGRSVELDVVSYSRGGLVFRSLAELLIPGATWRPTIGRAVFVGVVNNGTLLAAPDHWRTLLDLYTNLGVAACRGLALLPHALPAAAVLGQLIQGVGGFAKYLAAQTVTEGGIPGLAAMEPGGPFLQQLNATQPGQAGPDESRYFAVTSNFNARLALTSAPELPRQLLLGLADGFLDRLMGEANDLVVNTASMTAIDPGSGAFIKDQLDYGDNGAVYHLNYFLQPKTAAALGRWLQLPLPEPGRRLTLAGEPGRVTAEPAPVSLESRILVVEATEPTGEAIEQITAKAPAFVVVRRFHQGRYLHYAFRAEEIVGRAGDPAQPLINTLGLHEYQASAETSPNCRVQGEPDSSWLSRRRVVAVEQGRPVGVFPEAAVPLSAAELATLAGPALPVAGPVPTVQRRRGFAGAVVGTASPVAAPVAMPAAAAPAAVAAPAPSAPPKTGDGLGAATAIDFPPARHEDIPSVACHFRATMEEEITLGAVTTVEVELSREPLIHFLARVSAAASGRIDPSRNLIVLVIPKVNLRAEGDTRLEIAPPPAGQPTRLYFDLRSTDVGEAEVWVVIRQSQVPLATLVLRPRVVEVVSGPPRHASVRAETAEAPVLTEPLHQLSIFERRQADQVFYQFVFDSPALGLKSSFESKPIAGDRLTYVNRLYEEIENRWVSTRGDGEAFGDELRAFGGQLWDELLPPDLQRVLWQHRDRLPTLMVFSEEPFVPWELVHLKEPGQSLAGPKRFLAQHGLVRWLHNLGWPPVRLRLRPERCRFVIPNYPHPDYRLPEASQEAAFLQAQLQATAVDPQPGPVRRLLAEGGGFDLLHFACHGEAEAGNIANARLRLEGRVENQNYIPAFLSATTVEQHAALADPEGNRPVIVLNACQAGRAGYQLTGIGGFARAFLSRGAGVFVGTLWSVGDSPARTFTESFYQSLKSGRTVAQASIAARAAAEAAGDATWLAYAVYGHPHARLV